MRRRPRVIVAVFVAIFAAAAAILGAIPASAASTTTLVNFNASGQQVIRFDVNGNAVDAHDGTIARFGDTYYLYGTSYDCGFEWQNAASPFCGFKTYSSPDLVHWTDLGFMFDAQGQVWQATCGHGVGCFRPHVIYDAATSKYVLWFNAGNTPSGYYTLTSDSPAGPFTDPQSPTLAVPGSNGDEGLFVDDDGTAYVAYTSWSRGGDLIVERLAPDDRSGTGQYSDLQTASVEAPAMFKRQGRYYVSFSDPNCGYCSGTGTSYVWSASPLGPWTGAATAGPWTIQDGALHVTGGGIGLSKAGVDWTDYTFAADVTPLQTATQGGISYAQAGLVARMSDGGSGYAFLLSNYPYTSAAASGYITFIKFSNGNAVSAQPAALPFAVTGGTAYHVAITVSGSSIAAAVNGTTVETVNDASYPAGKVGFREFGAEQAIFDNVTVTAPNGSVLLADDFSGGLSQWDPPPTPFRGLSISSNSCGGQPSFVTTVPQAQGSPLYLYGSDLWDGSANEALANYYWEPLRFATDGSILPLTCGDSYSLALAGSHQGEDTPPANLDQSSGSAGFQAYCDVQQGVTRTQTFTAGRTGTLSRIAVTMFQENHVDSALTLSVAPLDASGQPGPALWSTSVPAASVSWSPREVAGQPDVPVTAGQRYAVQISAPGATRGCYGFAYSDANPYPAGGELYSSNGGQTWTAETGRDLKFDTSVTNGQ